MGNSGYRLRQEAPMMNNSSVCAGAILIAVGAGIFAIVYASVSILMLLH